MGMTITDVARKYVEQRDATIALLESGDLLHAELTGTEAAITLDHLNARLAALVSA